MTGLSLDTIRAWERRYQAVTPTRNERGRVYSDRDVERLTHLASLVSAGHAISTVATLPDAKLPKLLARTVPRPLGSTAASVDVAPLMAALNEFDLLAVESQLARHAMMLPADQFIFSVVLPLLRETGWRWQGGGIRPAHEHLLTAVIRTMLGAMLRTVPRAPGAPVMLFATPAGERHELGLLSAAVLAAQAGYAVLYLGPDLPAADIATAATRSRARVLVLAATSNAALAADDVTALRRLASRIAVWTGGAQAAALASLIGKGVHAMDDLDGFATMVTNRDR